MSTPDSVVSETPSPAPVVAAWVRRHPTLRLAFGQFDPGRDDVRLLVSVKDAKTDELLGTDELRTVATFLDSFGYNWIPGSQALYKAGHPRFTLLPGGRA